MRMLADCLGNHMNTSTSLSQTPDVKRIVALVGSRRGEGNSSILARRLQERASLRGVTVDIASVSKRFPGEYLSLTRIESCRACGRCKGTGVCVIDDAVAELFTMARKADGFIWISPVYFGSVPADLKAIIDRCQSLYERRALIPPVPKAERRPASVFIVGAGGDPYGWECALTPINAANAMLEFNPREPIVILGPDARGDIMNDEFATDLVAVDRELDALIDAIIERSGSNGAGE